MSSFDLMQTAKKNGFEAIESNNLKASLKKLSTTEKKNYSCIWKLISCWACIKYELNIFFYPRNNI